MADFCIIGIDPGNDGGLSRLSPNKVTVAPMPTIEGVSKGVRTKGGAKETYDRHRREIDLGTVILFLKHRNPNLVVIEHCQAMPGNGAVSMFNYGKGFGQLIGALAALGIRTEFVKPQKWKKEVLSGTAKDKAAAISYCARVFPNVDLRATPRSTKSHDGMADALCMAEYGRRLLGVQ